MADVEYNCLCPKCGQKYAIRLEEAATESTDLDGGPYHALEYLEELRMTLGTFLKPDVLEGLLELWKVLDKGPKQFSWFVRHSLGAEQCRYAQGALEAFKKKRLDRTIELLETCLEKVKALKSE